jgi:outer membrane protein
MRSLLRATVIALVVTLVAGEARAQAALKIAYVNTQALMEAAPGRAAAESVLQKEGEGYRAQITKMQDPINVLLAKYQKDEPTLSAAAKDKAQKQIQAMETDAQAQQLKFQQQFAQRQSEVMAPITDAVKKVLDDIRTEDGYAMILSNDPQTTSIVSADKNLDITDRVVSRLHTIPASSIKAAEPKKAGAPTAPAGVTRPPAKPPAQ